MVWSSPPFSAKVKNKWVYSSTSPNTFTLYSCTTEIWQVSVFRFYVWMCIKTLLTSFFDT
jgi:hypothetical protein